MVTLNINNVDYQVNVDTSMPLLWVLRDVLGLTGTKYGCGKEICGACTVLVNGRAERTCDFDLGEAVGKKITTIEGLSADLSHPLQRAWIEHQVPQCGYCQSGMIMAVASELNQGRAPADIVNEIDNICSCGTFQRIKAAILSL
ncbi:(2Fe-2S)-binding protein [soil metagenome]